jgi:hypothetical protein
VSGNCALRRVRAGVAAALVAVVLTGGSGTTPDWSARGRAAALLRGATVSVPASAVTATGTAVPARESGPVSRAGALFGTGAGLGADPASGPRPTTVPTARSGSSNPAAATAGFTLERTTLADGHTSVLRWNPCQVITYKIDVDAVPVATRAAALHEIRVAVGRLAMATGLTYGYRGATTEIPRTTTIDRQSAELVIAVTDPNRTDIGIGGRVLGYGGYHYWRWSGARAPGGAANGAAIARGWVVLDRTGWLALPSGFGPGVRQGNVILHELAHTVGLDHVGDRRQLMYPTLLAGGPDGYASGDRSGLNRVGRAAGCIAIPRGVISDLG